MDKDQIKFLIASHCSRLGMSYTIKPIDLNEAAKELAGEFSRKQAELDNAIKALKSLAGIEAWIQDREMKEHFQNTVYPVISPVK